MSAEADQRHMRRAIDLAGAQLGRTGENPAVGCVLVADDVVIAEAATADGGRPHAEEQALAAAGDRARGATAYVTRNLRRTLERNRLVRRAASWRRASPGWCSPARTHTDCLPAAAPGGCVTRG